MAKKTRTELSTLAINTNLPDNTTELITPTTERAQLTDERESVVNYKDDLGGVSNAGKFITVATDGESLTMVDEPQGDIQGSGVDGEITYWDGTKTVTSDAMLLIDTTNKRLKIVIPAANGSGGISLNAVSAVASSSLTFLNNGVKYAQIYYDNSTGNLRLASDGDVEINPSGTLSVDSGATFSGNVGIGIAPSTNSLHIYKSDPILLIQSSNTSGDAELQFFPRDGSNVAHLQSIKGEGSSLVFSTGGNSNNGYAPTEALTISSGGDATFENNIIGKNTVKVQNDGYREYQFLTSSGSLRWSLYSLGGNETGSNAGSNLDLARYNDSGGYAGGVLNISRSTGVVSIPNGVVFNNNSVTGNKTNVTLNAYEEGTWTAQIWDAITGGTQSTIVNNVSRYTRVGRLVTLQASLSNITIAGTTTNTMYIRNLPFSIGSNQMSAGAANFYQVDFGGQNGILWANAAANTGILRVLKQNSAGAGSTLKLNNIDNTSGYAEISFTIQYTT